MTNKEAVKIIKASMLMHSYRYSGEELKEAFDMAINALDEQVVRRFTRKDLENWLYLIAMSNKGNELERSCIELISRLDGFEQYVDKEAESEIRD